MLLADCIGSRENRIDQIRLGAALAVFVGHSWHIATGPQAIVPTEHFLNIGFHELAVFVFFFLSGMLISESARRYQGRMARFVWARARRLLPALCINAICIPLLLIATGAWTGPSPGGVFEYAVRLVTLISVEFTRPNVFADLPFAHAINGSVWSLRHEVFVYAIIGLTAVLGLFAHRAGILVVTLILSAWTITGHVLDLSGEPLGGLAFIIEEGRYLAFACLLGCLAHRFAHLIPVDSPGGINIGLLIFAGTAVAHIFLDELVYMHALIIFLSYATLLIAYAGPGEKSGLSGDISYGVYIYAWPLQQLTVYVHQSITGAAPSPLVLIALALPAVLLAGYLSWILVEKPALRLAYPGWVDVLIPGRTLRPDG